MTKEIRQAKVLEVRQTDDGPQADIRILTYNVVDSYGTSWNPGVFKRSIDESDGTVSAVWSHDPSRPIGVVSDFRDDGQHLDGTLKYLDFDACPDARMSYEAMKKGAIKGISFGFARKNDEPDTEHRGATRITDADIFECSGVLNAAVPGSRTLAVRSDEPLIAKSEAAELLLSFERGDIDLADALSALKSAGARAAVEEEVREPEEVEVPEVDEVETEPDLDIEAAFARLNRGRR